MEYLIRFVQLHESFRKAEILALAELADVNVEVLIYSEYVCCIRTYRPLLYLCYNVILSSAKVCIVTLLYCPTKR